MLHLKTTPCCLKCSNQLCRYGVQAYLRCLKCSQSKALLHSTRYSLLFSHVEKTWSTTSEYLRIFFNKIYLEDEPLIPLPTSRDAWIAKLALVDSHRGSGNSMEWTQTQDLVRILYRSVIIYLWFIQRVKLTYVI